MKRYLRGCGLRATPQQRGLQRELVVAQDLDLVLVDLRLGAPKAVGLALVVIADLVLVAAILRAVVLLRRQALALGQVQDLSDV
jgi:hypothetical protein